MSCTQIRNRSCGKEIISESRVSNFYDFLLTVSTYGLLVYCPSRDASQQSAEEANIVIYQIKMYKGPSLT